VQIASFDIFDTVLTRCVGNPHAVFVVLGRRLAAAGMTGDAAIFAGARVSAEARARRRADPREVDLEAIYRELVAAAVLDLAAVPRAIAMEIELEAEMIRPVPGARAEVAAARSAGKRVVFVSDMYLPLAFLKGQLVRHGFWSEGDGLYVSSDLHLTKKSGALFDHVVQREGAAAASIVHRGNDAESDVRSAVRSGVRAEHFFDGNLGRYESIFESWSMRTEGLTSVVAGAARLARIEGTREFGASASLAEVAAGVAGPALTGFVIWLLREARNRGIRRMFFVSRDGEILLRLARQLAPSLSTKCELRYLYGSRQAWHLPSIADGVANSDRKWILDETDSIFIR
jgi:predicted HAD superfamily hydrolase